MEIPLKESPVGVTSPPIVEKENIKKSNFPDFDVLNDNQAIENRLQLLQFATVLGNSNKQKVMITFCDSEGLKRVCTTIWAYDKKRITLKGGNHIPVRCILDINFYGG